MSRRDSVESARSHGGCRRSAVFALSVLVAVLPLPARGDGDTSEAAEKAKLEIEQLRLQNAKAQQDLLSLRGTAEIGDVTIEPEIVSQDALRKIAQWIVSDTACKVDAGK